MSTQESEVLQRNGKDELTAAQRARAERQRQRALALRDARLVAKPQLLETAKICTGKQIIDTGGGFLLEEEEEESVPVRQNAAAPIVHSSEQPRCMDCDRLFPQSYLFDTFGYHVCDECRDEEVHSLITRTEAKTEFLLKDCDIDSRPPPLQFIRRRNPHRAGFSDMRLYLRAQIEERALVVWGTEEQLEEERERRRSRRDMARQTAATRRMRALRMNVRSSVYDRTRVAHTHTFGPEQYNSDDDIYSRKCIECGHIETYEKM